MSDIPLHHWFRRRQGFLERTLTDLRLILDRSWDVDVAAGSNGFLHSLDARVKLGAAVLLTVHAASARRLSTLAVLIGAVMILAAASRIRWNSVMRLWLGVGVTAALLAIPALFLTAGKPVYIVPGPRWTITDTGSLLATKLVLRALATSAIAAVLVLSTSWQLILKAMRSFGVPVIAVVLAGMSYRYIVLFLQTAIEMMDARKSRTVGRLPAVERRRLALSSIGVLMERAFHLGNEIHFAMQARGYRGEVYLMDEFAMNSRDWLTIVALVPLEAILLLSRA